MIDYLASLPIRQQSEAARSLHAKFAEVEDRYFDGGSPYGDVEELSQYVENIATENPADDAVTISGCLHAAIDDPGACFGVRNPSEHTRIITRHFKTGCHALDAGSGGGGYGLTVCGGVPGIGKSWLAISSAVDAAAEGWTVAYFNAELEPAEIDARFARVSGGLSYAQRHRLHVMEPPGAASVQAAVAAIDSSILHGSTRRILVVLDSINRLVGLTKQQNGGHYFERLWAWGEFARRATLFSAGRVAFFVVSELNQGGSDKGQQLGYAASLSLRLRSGETPGTVDLQIVKNRRFPSIDIPTLKFDIRSGRFVIDSGEF